MKGLSRSNILYGSDQKAKEEFLKEALVALGDSFVLEFGVDTSLGIDDVHEIKRKSMLAPGGDKKQVFIVRRADQMTQEAAQAFLKILEEPPEGSFFFLLADSLNMPETLLSRMARFAFWSGDIELEKSEAFEDMLNARILILKNKLEDSITQKKEIDKVVLHKLFLCLDLYKLASTTRIPAKYLTDSLFMVS